MKAYAMVLKEYNKPLVPREFDIVDPPKGEMLVKVLAAGICGSDVHMWKGNDPRLTLPMILGHEGVGQVVSLSQPWTDINGEAVKEGDIIIWDRGVTCGKCYYCAVKREPSLCENRWTYGINTTCKEPPYLRGCYSEYMYLAAGTKIIKIKEEVDLAVLVAASCSGATTAHAFDILSPDIGDSVLIQGPGPIGLFAVAFAKARGARNIIVIGGTKERLEMCKLFGANVVLNRNNTTQEQRRQQVLDITSGRGVDVAIEAVGHPSAVSEGIKLVRSGGAYLSVGFGDPNGTVTLDCYYDVVRKNLRYQGVWVSDTKHLNIAVNMVLNDIEKFKLLVTDRYYLKDANKALNTMEKKETIKSVLIPHI
ncbi:Threonine dehydrogenase [Caldanaerobius fijiensis DSM 17918]|uniref:Threonine dehydrogenase n=1 Tax=Caldanaerobius fijiensis DSM 17918 TaxID=1121256 RepID=A0A1M5CS90_9THEO|nr:zinc-binding dehydrogenase [Caldanaerobius fijiensis]SHF57222.1 Threonine dehydrogenase [Caldanaerobius fijiensis DSM 17918]